MRFLSVDFGTSSTLAALIDGSKKLRFVDFGEKQYSAPTVLYFPSRQQGGNKTYLIGTKAIREYLEEGGRLLFSIKSLLGEPSFDTTMVSGFGPLSAVQLCGLYLKQVKRLAEKQFCNMFEGVVLGRPVNFSKKAIQELQEAAQLAGFKKVVFVPEPIAAGVKYLNSRKGEKETIFILDAGGGTTDFAVLQSQDRNTKVLATGGLSQAGNALSSAIAYHHLAVHLGKNATLGIKKIPIPTHYYEALKDWKKLQFLKTERLGRLLADCSQRDEFGRFVKLVSNNLGWGLYEAVNAAKQRLSTHRSAAVSFRALDLNVPLTLTEFERYTWDVLRVIEKEALSTLKRSRVASDISTVILTGGTSQVPAIQKMVRDIFPHCTLVLADPFSSVVGGLALVANRLNSK